MMEARQPLIGSQVSLLWKHYLWLAVIFGIWLNSVTIRREDHYLTQRGDMLGNHEAVAGLRIVLYVAGLEVEDLQTRRFF